MSWASEQFWRELAKIGIYPNIPDWEPEPEEHRCDKCKERDICPAYKTGVIYPCPYYKED